MRRRDVCDLLGMSNPASVNAMTPQLDQETWLGTFQELLRYYLPPLESSPLVNVGSLAAVALGFFLVFRSWKFERFVVASFGLVIGAWLGYWLSLIVGTPKPVTAAVVAVGMTVVAYRTYRWWLACGSVVILFCLAIVFQLGRGDLQRYLPDLAEGLPTIQGDMIEQLPSAEEMASNMYPKWSDQLAKMKDPLLRELKALGPVGWLFPVAAAIVGGLLAYWALRAFSVIWLGFAGAVVFLLGAATFLSTHWPNVRTWLIAEPQYPAGFAIGLWLLGLILQAKEARIPKKQSAKPAGAQESSKS